MSLRRERNERGRGGRRGELPWAAIRMSSLRSSLFALRSFGLSLLELPFWPHYAAESGSDSLSVVLFCVQRVKPAEISSTFDTFTAASRRTRERKSERVRERETEREWASESGCNLYQASGQCPRMRQSTGA